MKIQYIAPSPKANQVEHVSQQVGQTLCAAGFAVAVPIPDRNKPDPTNAWLKYVQEEDAMRKPSAHDTVGAVAQGSVEWGIKALSSGTVVVIKKVGAETYFLDGPGADAPLSVRQQFLDAASVNPEANAVAIENAKQAQEKQARADKWAGRRQVMSAMFGSKPL